MVVFHDGGSVVWGCGVRRRKKGSGKTPVLRWDLFVAVGMHAVAGDAYTNPTRGCLDRAQKRDRGVLVTVIEFAVALNH